jgi:hypothetical protein
LLATHNYTEIEALDLSVRNLTMEWRSEFRRLVECNCRTGQNEGTLPFHFLSMSQLSTTFMQYSPNLAATFHQQPVLTNCDRYPSNVAHAI